ncbi:MAG: radical SAM protein [Ruminococcaceae bacterium]|nr:radical SAM protein [Oscillospiraceae bacterium]
MPKKAYLEITNACNLNCSFCHKTKREIKYISKEEFINAATKLRSFADYLYFHLMGEPLLHPLLGEFLAYAYSLGFKVILTTNGTLLKKREEILLNAPALHKISISLHSYEANEMGIDIDSYLDSCFDFCKKASEKGKIAVMRLWNKGGKENLNEYILNKMRLAFPDNWSEIYSGYRLKTKVFLEWGEKFDWPDIENETLDDNISCYGLRDQIGVLSSGTVVPCCLDSDGVINLGNIFTEDLDDILNSERAVNLRESFIKRKVCEELCKKCGYAHQKKY